MWDEDDGRPLVRLSALEHHVYCPRQAALIHVDGVWSDNRHTVRGSAGHRRADTGADRRERGVTVLRGLEVWSERLGLTGRCDVVEVADDGTLTPVEYKMGVRHGQAADVQLCAQALCLEEMFDTKVDRGFVWYGAPRRRVEVPMDASLRRQTSQAVDELRSRLSAHSLPVAPNDARCAECQLLQHCLPSVVATPERVTTYVRELFR